MSILDIDNLIDDKSSNKKNIVDSKENIKLKDNNLLNLDIINL